jgi:hypothetical protein
MFGNALLKPDADQQFSRMAAAEWTAKPTFDSFAPSAKDGKKPRNNNLESLGNPPWKRQNRHP